MNKMFYSFDDGNIYMLSATMPIDTAMEELTMYNGVLIYADDSKLELVEYNYGNEVEFDTRLITDLGTNVAVNRSKRVIKDGE